MALDLNDPAIQELIAKYLSEFDPPNTKFVGSQDLRPVMEIEHKGRPDGFDILGNCLRLTISPAGTASEGLLIAGLTTTGNLIRVFNVASETPADYHDNTLVLSYDGRLGIMTPIGHTIAGRLELEQYSDIPVLVINAFTGALSDLAQFLNQSDVKVTWIDHSGQVTTTVSAFFGGDGIQVGSTSQDFGAGVKVIGLDNASPNPSTNPTGGVVLYASGGQMRYRDPTGLVWRWPDGDLDARINQFETWTFDPLVALDEGRMVPGVLYMQKVYLPTTLAAATRICLIRGQNLGGVGSVTDFRVGLYDTSGNRLVTSANVLASIAASGLCTLTIPSTALTGSYYYIAALAVGSGAGPLFAISGALGSNANANLTATTYRFSSGPTGQTSLPATVTMASRSSTDVAMWSGLPV